MKNFVFFCFLLVVSAANLFPQLDPPIEWGEIPKEDMEMKSFPHDSNATAYILCDYGESKYNNDFRIEFTRHIRIKILNQNGYKWGDFSIPIYTEDGTERVRNVEGITYNLNSSGEVIETELDDDDVFEEEVDDKHTVVKFTLPALQPGSIIEVKYKIISKSILLMKEWTFQHSEPVRWSEYRIIYPKCLAYPVVSIGYEAWEDNSVTEIKQKFRGEALKYVPDDAPCYQHRYAVKNLPALRDEPFITTIDDYTNKVLIQLGGYSFPWTGKQTVLKDWETLANELHESDYLGDAIDVTGDVEKIASQITSSIADPVEKMKAIYNWVSKSIVCDERNRFYIDEDVDDVLEYKKGSNAEITVLLLSLLEASGIQAYPVILSTRDHGKIQNIYPITTQFNYLMAKVNVGNEYYLLDATSPLRPFDLLPSRVLNVPGLVVKEGPPEWIGITNSRKNISNSIVSVNIMEDGTLTGYLEESFSEYKSVDIRADLSEKKDVDLAVELFDTETMGITIDSVSFIDKDNIDVSLKVKAHISSDNYFQTSGDMIYINPHILHRLTENPFKSVTRKFPVDYGYTRGYKILVKIKIPDGYEFKEKFAPKSFALDNSTSYSRHVQAAGNEIQILLKFDINEPIIKAVNYEGLKAFYAFVIASQAEQLVLGKKLAASDEVNSVSGTK
ncbi:MAG: DUF3857 and transglutaminase domain-containing protein [Ignavibacteriaceae bacterium]